MERQPRHHFHAGNCLTNQTNRDSFVAVNRNLNLNLLLTNALLTSAAVGF
jgi:hypothetical protein